MSDWKLQQMVKASGWPLPPDTLAPGTDFNAPASDGVVPLHWACREGKDGLLKHMLAHGARVLPPDNAGLDLLALALQSKSYQAVMMVMDALKHTGAPPPDAAMQQQLTQAFNTSHTNAKNRLAQSLWDWKHPKKPRGTAPTTGRS